MGTARSSGPQVIKNKEYSGYFGVVERSTSYSKRKVSVTSDVASIGMSPRIAGS